MDGIMLKERERLNAQNTDRRGKEKRGWQLENKSQEILSTVTTRKQSLKRKTRIAETQIPQCKKKNETTETNPSPKVPMQSNPSIHPSHDIPRYDL
jgi:hypothetical protein